MSPTYIIQLLLLISTSTTITATESTTSFQHQDDAVTKPTTNPVQWYHHRYRHQIRAADIIKSDVHRKQETKIRGSGRWSWMKNSVGTCLRHRCHSVIWTQWCATATKYRNLLPMNEFDAAPFTAKSDAMSPHQMTPPPPPNPTMPLLTNPMHGDNVIILLMLPLATTFWLGRDLFGASVDNLMTPPFASAAHMTRLLPHARAVVGLAKAMTVSWLPPPAPLPRASDQERER